MALEIDQRASKSTLAMLNTLSEHVLPAGASVLRYRGGQAVAVTSVTVSQRKEKTVYLVVGQGKTGHRREFEINALNAHEFTLSADLSNARRYSFTNPDKEVIHAWC